MVWHNNVSLIVYSNKEPRLRQVEITRKDTKSTKYVLGFFGTNRLKWAAKYVNVGIWVEYWSDVPPWQFDSMRERIPILVSGLLLSRTPRPGQDKTDHFTFIKAKHLTPLTPRIVDDPEMMIVRRSSFMHLHAFAKEHGYTPRRQHNVNHGAPRDDSPPLDPADEEELDEEPQDPLDW